MQAKKKFFLASLAVLVLIAVLLSGAALYLYTHPHVTKALAEKVIGAYTESHVTIGKLSYAVNPCRLVVRDVHLEPQESRPGFSLRISQLGLRLALEGDFGHKTLVIENMAVNGCFLRLGARIQTGMWKEKSKHSSYFSALFGRLTGFFFFREVKLRAVELHDCAVKADLGNQVLDIDRLEALLTPEHRIRASFKGDFLWKEQEIRVMGQEIQLTTDQSISLTEPVLKGSVRVRDAVIQAPSGEVKAVNLDADLLFDGGKEKVLIEPANLDFTSIVLKPDEKHSLPAFDAHLELRGSYLVGERKLALSTWRAEFGQLLQASGTLTFQGKPGENLRITVVDGRTLPQDWLPFLPQKIRKEMEPLRLTGAVHLSGDVAGLTDDRGLRWTYHLETTLEGNKFSLSSKGLDMVGDVSGLMKAEGAYPSVALNLLLKLTDISLKSGGLSLKGLDARLALKGKHPAYTIEDLTLHFPKGALLLGAKEDLVESFRVGPEKAHLDLDKGILRLSEGTLLSPLLGDFKLSFMAGPDGVEFRPEVGLCRARRRGTGPPRFDAQGKASEFRIHMQLLSVRFPRSRSHVHGGKGRPGGGIQGNGRYPEFPRRGECLSECGPRRNAAGPFLPGSRQNPSLRLSDRHFRP